ncbi:class I SAM-dependent methyltransferase [Nitrosomonas ureae]|uniref:SAM-dependent methyltransferase, MidA family n=1 Tax=Nitrosomonas ureae TaxID=44577 RepID=A0A1H9ELX1_9PROT|nr:SAM-dependent methyltransferase [Nitrosomonas ureae]SEQ26223.1 SAM-dependent methyltransferase, MidA family [Nitrosomonas ureae]
MSLHTSFPLASEIALAHSQSVLTLIKEQILASDGWIPFEQFMNLALYAPGMGYYSSGATKLGSAGDFVTAPEISSLFGRTLALQLSQIFQCLKHPYILEFGAGSGRLALDILIELEKAAELPEKYFIMEVSAELRQRQQTLLASKAPHLIHRVEWLERLPDQFNGIILANEVLDAMPVHLVAWHDNAIFERGVIWQNNQLAWQDRPLQNIDLHLITGQITSQINLDNDSRFGYVSEFNLAAIGFMRSLAKLLHQGVILLIDYGFGRDEYYHPQRNQGTLMCHYRHYAHDNPFYLPGLQDITSHVDFSALTHAAIDSNLTLLGYTTQAFFLINSGITKILAQIPVEDNMRYLPQSNQLQKLINPAEMGELFKAIAFGKEFSEPLIGFSAGDMSRLL